ncbi:chemotaxis protein CheX [Clostridium tetanomorphum]|uniref:Chemotaxis protein CheX n=1 Tax=Clostridium tetanomorphum TaxID=1553 RepID=A0A923J270_CLOTT|nr:chemotaxis protein CheX [Clostridium tetanomorphum]KAJ50056.1 chemotaxis protein CheX [Clostridium tetanomorphum DSM 665]MBC2399971.1 chemotaxis protein CheX [Clostridium tetanomorphum]MBP1865829.1 chemotaxis protein CheX [Clostridium tetanomorphum]NRS85278.1 chemotaxis protein CheX [Clostridium tetanomorphum]NRZ98455.1 chemotaxis protein CheX [Clostridium tetanomorphum]
MDVKLINPFIEAFYNVMPQIGFFKIEKGEVYLKEKHLSGTGVLINLGLVGDFKGNIIYGIDLESAKKIASTMMMGMPVSELDDMAQSAISELTNMLTANASINFSNMGKNINISTPTLIYGDKIEIKVNTDKVLCIKILVDDIPIEINVAIHIT